MWLDDRLANSLAPRKQNDSGMTQQALDEVAKAPDAPEPWIEAGYFPGLPGPRPLVVGPVAVGLGNLALTIFPGSGGYLVINGLLLGLLLVVTFAVQAPQEPVMDRVNILSLFALALVGTTAGYFVEDAAGMVVRHVVVTANGLLLWLAHHLKAVRYAWWITVHASDHWDAAGLARYGAFLRSARPGPGSPRVARELYRVACGEFQKAGAQSAAATEAMTTYAEMLKSGEGGRADPQQAKWWHDKAAE